MATANRKLTTRVAFKKWTKKLRPIDTAWGLGVGAAGMAIPAFIGGATLGGAAGGAVSGAGFYTLGTAGTAQFTGSGLFTASWQGAATGAASGFMGSSIGGGLGAFAAGATGGIMNTGFKTDWEASGQDYLRAAIIGGGLSVGLFYGMQAVKFNYSYKKAGGTMSFEQWNRVSIQSQRSFLSKREWGAWLLDDGGIEGWGFGDKIGVEPTMKPANAIGEIHTHPNSGKTEFNVFSRTDADYIGTKNAYLLTQSDGLKTFDLDAANRLSTENGCFQLMKQNYYETNFGNQITHPTQFGNNLFTPSNLSWLLYGY